MKSASIKFLRHASLWLWEKGNKSRRKVSPHAYKA
uniref:Uncharacterized protein n=1 Tax=Rhizophora mucronata TaxID=61149 RepID=A0A2P2N4K7_RHIMU